MSNTNNNTFFLSFFLTPIHRFINPSINQSRIPMASSIFRLSVFIFSSTLRAYSWSLPKRSDKLSCARRANPIAPLSAHRACAISALPMRPFSEYPTSFSIASTTSSVAHAMAPFSVGKILFITSSRSSWMLTGFPRPFPPWDLCSACTFLSLPRRSAAYASHRERTQCCVKRKRMSEFILMKQGFSKGGWMGTPACSPSLFFSSTSSSSSSPSNANICWM
mmetsp:Transcript_39980/g.78790  ORF Transcript_39980/g.78790 Transcript_39980/m.78790 type:complete len:221 (+) Transcript_39980:3-665(+)